jgi:hypothetical protein
MTLEVVKWAREIAGYGSRSKRGSGSSSSGSGGGSSGTGGGIEQPNSLRSKQLARIIDLLSEGPVHGIVSMADVWYDGVPLYNAATGTWNFSSLQVGMYGGWPNQPLLAGFAAQQAETAVSQQIKYGNPIIRHISDTNTDRCRVTLSVPALQVSDKKTGNIDGTTVQFAIYVQNNGGGWQNIGGTLAISGKTNTRYQRSYIVSLPGTGPWDIRVDRFTADSTVVEMVNDLYWDSYTAIIDSRVSYNLSAIVGTTIDAEQFNSIPRRTYRMYGLYCLVPNNYDPWSRTYYGVWNGGWQFAWTNNPAWVLFDLLTNGRYGLGDYVSTADVDAWSFYAVARWCDGAVPDGRGGVEARWAFNGVINSRGEAYDLLQSVAAIFRGDIYWAGGKVFAWCDQPSDPVGLYTNANVIDGVFRYEGADVRARHTVAHVTWNDPNNLGEPRIAVVENQAEVSRFGMNKLDMIAVGCISEGQAIRTGKWALFTEQYESEILSFRTGIQGAWARPGDVIEVADATVSGERVGGRVVSATTTVIETDSPVTYSATSGTHYIACQLPSGKVEIKPAYVQEGSSTITVAVGIGGATAFSEAPSPDAVWIMSHVPTLEAQLWRVVRISEPETGVYEIIAMPYNKSKWGYVENNLVLQIPDITNINMPVIEGLTVTDFLVALSSISIGVRMMIAWKSDGSTFEVSWRVINGNWSTINTAQMSLEVGVEEGKYEIWVTPMDAIGFRGNTVKTTYTVVGRSAPPANVANFRVQVVEGVAMFQWAPSPDLDVIIGGSFEMRYSPRTVGVTWASSNTVITSIPGAATTAELPFRPGTYLIRARDITGLFSLVPSVIITAEPDTAFRPLYRICEQPTWLGNKVLTTVKMPEQWLMIDALGGGLWDAQTGNVDTWPTIDVLPGNAPTSEPLSGTYDFFNMLDLGGIFPTRLAVEMFAFPVNPALTPVDSRPGNVDDWQAWDDAGDGGGGMVTIRMRQTNDDPSASPVWTDWQQFLAGEYTARAFQFQAWLAAPAGENVAVEELCITADLSAKQDEGADVVWVPNKMHITFDVKFYTLPSLSIAIQNGVVGDTFKITNKTREGFDVELLNASGIITAARTFDWMAQGF